MPSLGGWRLAALGQAGEKPKISPASWAWAARGSSHPGPPRVSEGVRVCRSGVPYPGHRGQSRAPGARPRRGAAPGCSLVFRGGGGEPFSPSGPGKRKGESRPFPSASSPHFLFRSPLSLSRSAGSGCVAGAARSARASKAEMARGKSNQGAEAWTGNFPGPWGRSQTPCPHPGHPVPTSFPPLTEIPSLSHHQQKVGAVVKPQKSFERLVLP